MTAPTDAPGADRSVLNGGVSGAGALALARPTAAEGIDDHSRGYERVPRYPVPAVAGKRPSAIPRTGERYSAYVDVR
jgi:hypothetical protein